MTRLRWFLADFRTGQNRGEVPQLLVQQELQQLINGYSTGSVVMPIAGDVAPLADWRYLTEPYRSVLIAADGSDTSPLPQPMWGGIIQQRDRDLTIGPTLTLATAESYLARRNIRATVQYPGATWGACRIAADLLTRFVLDSANGLPGPQLRVVVLDDGVMGQDKQWQDADDKSVYSAFGELEIEWSVSWEWRTTAGALPTLAPVLTIGTRIGTPAASGLAPAVTFAYPGNLAAVKISDDYTSDHGGNDVMAYSDGIGEVRPQSDHQVAADFGGRVAVEDRYSAGQSIGQLSVLNSDAAQTLRRIQNGSTAVTFTGLYGRAPRFGSDWGIGDDIRYDVQGPQFPEHPSGTVRAIGVRFTDSTFSPILAGDTS